MYWSLFSPSHAQYIQEKQISQYTVSPSAANLHRGQVESTSLWVKSSCVVPDRGAHLLAVVNVSLSIELMIGSLPFGRRFESAD